MHAIWKKGFSWKYLTLIFNKKVINQFILHKTAQRTIQNNILKKWKKNTKIFKTLSVIMSTVDKSHMRMILLRGTLFS